MTHTDFYPSIIFNFTQMITWSGYYPEPRVKSSLNVENAQRKVKLILKKVRQI